jgi:hypothetical protein
MHINIDRVFTTVSRNLGLEDFTRYTNSWIEWAYEAEKLIGSVDTFIQKEVTYDATGAKASGTITFAANPTSGDSITLNGVDIFFKSATSLGAAKGINESKIDTTLSLTLTDETTSPYGLFQRLSGFVSNVAMTDYSPTFHYPDALNIAGYSISSNLSSELISDPTLNDATGWSVNNPGGTQVGSGTHTFDNDGSYSDLRYIAYDLINGQEYQIVIVVDSIDAGVTILLNDGVNYPILVDTAAAGTYTTTFIADTTNQSNLILYHNPYSSLTNSAVISNVSLKKVESIDLTITAKEIGHDGNDYTLSSDNANAKISGLTLTGGKGIYRNQQIILPEDNLKLLGVRVGTDDSSYEHASIKKTSAIHRGRVGKNTDDSQQRAFRYYIDGNRLNITHDDIDEITINYLAYPTDARGWPMIKEGHETAVAQYIMWQMKLIDFYNGKLPQYITKELEKRWYQLCGKARGDDSMPTSEELKQIGNMWNTLVPITNDRSSLIDF